MSTTAHPEISQSLPTANPDTGYLANANVLESVFVGSNETHHENIDGSGG